MNATDSAPTGVSSSSETTFGSYDPNGAAPTPEQYAALLAAFDHFNHQLFEGRLPPVLLTLAQHRKAAGYFIGARWGRRSDGVRLGEISICPDSLHRDARDSASTLLHEMVHLWQHVFGKPSRRGYHNAEFATEMEHVGLVASDTGVPGGKRMGQRMTHYVLEGGAFDVAFAALGADWIVPFTPAGESARGKVDRKHKVDRSKRKHVCLCGQAAWGKEGLNLLCPLCGNALTVVDDEEG